uniref:Serum response factor-binding protein 1 n=1 Tax=Stomoxys calcitrans TaxID=35570 RepID=A0A1I8PTE3_STOCA
MLNKLQFNNMVISNKKGIQQARIQTINKLVHKIRKLKNLQEKKPNDSKCKERINKSTETMEQLKKFKRVDIMKAVLLLERPPAAVITNGLSTPEEMAVALLAMNKVMQGLAKRFMMELKLEDPTNSSWRDELKESSKRKQKFQRTEEKKRKRMELKEQKAIARKRQEWMEQNCDGLTTGEDEKDSDGNVSTVGGWKIEDVQKEIKQETKEYPSNIQSDYQNVVRERDNLKKKPKIEVKENKVQNKKRALESFPQQNFESSDIQSDYQNVVREKENLKKKSKIDVKENKVQNKKKALESSPQQNFESSEEEMAEDTHVVDPFFVTETGENYLSTAVSNRNQDNEEKNDEAQEDLHMIKLNGKKPNNGYRERKLQQTANKYSQRQTSHHKDNYPQKQRKWQEEKQKNNRLQWNSDTNFQRNNNTKTPPNRKTFEKQDEKLHPSWAAKQKLKPVITSFQGKKITFGTNEDGAAESRGSDAMSQKSKTIKDTKPENLNTDSLHPSWAAKQKLKPVITAFQGKKISFDNDE